MKYHPIRRVFALSLLQFLLVVSVAPLLGQEAQEAAEGQESSIAIKEFQEEADRPETELEDRDELGLSERFLGELKYGFPQELPFFGSFLFAISKRDLPAWQNLPVTPFYQLGEGDEISIQVWGELNLDLRLTVDPSGYILLPPGERLYVNGLSFGNLKAVILRELRKSYDLTLTPERLAAGDTSIEVMLNNVHGIQVMLIGQVAQPGGYTFSIPSVLLVDALGQSGGITSKGSVRAIQVHREEQVKSIDLYQLLVGGEVQAANYLLRHGDVVFVPYRSCVVSIQGAVQRPSIFELTEQETLKDLVKMAGGFIPNADVTRVQIKRIDKEKGFVLIDLNLLEMLPATIPLQDGDQVEVRTRSLHRREMFVKIEGRGVRNPGIYQLAEEGENLSELIDKAMLYDDAVTARMDLIRMEADYSKSKMILNIDEAIQQGFRLQPEDHLIIHSGYLLAGGDKQIHLKGHVKSPGTYILSQGLQLYDVLFTYGGFTDPDFRAQTYLERGDILRVNKQTGKKVIVPFCLEAVLGKEEDYDLESDDEIRVYPANKFRDPMFVTIEGEVRSPGRYALQEGMTLSDLLVQAAGLKEEAYILQAEVNRRNLDGSNPIQTLFIRLAQKEDDFKLHNHDRVFIRRLPYLDEPREVMIEGEVKFPGKYLLIEPNERLSQVIIRAGGLSEQAFLEGVQFTRRRSGEQHPVALDLEKALRGRIEHDLILTGGDHIYIPPRDWVVEVKGAVQIPQLVQYASNQKAKYYINLAGGYQPDADVNAAYIIRANRLILKASKRFWFDPVVPPGSRLVIPSTTAARSPLWKRHGIGFIGGALVSGLAIYWVD